MNGENQIKSIARDLENIAERNYYFCPECGTWGFWGDDDKQICPECENSDIYDMTMCDYFTDTYDVEYRVDSKQSDTIRSVKVCVAYGGPNIYIDTMYHKIKCAWWFDYSEVEISECVCNAVNTYFEELWNA